MLGKEGNVFACGEFYKLPHPVLVSFDFRMVRYLKENISFAEDTHVLRQKGGGPCVVSRRERLHYFARERGDDRDETFLILTKQFLIHARAFVESFEEGLRYKRHEILVPFIVLREQYQARALLASVPIVS